MSDDDLTGDDFVSDAELFRRWRVGEKTGRMALRELAKRGFPAPDPLFAHRRYWPAVKAFMAARYGISVSSIAPIDGGENEEADRPASSHRRARTALAASR